MTTTEDLLLPAVYDLLRGATFPPHPQTPKGVTVLFGAYQALATAELVAVTGASDTIVEANREELITFDVATLINVPGFSELRTWERRAEITAAIIEAMIGDRTLPTEIRDTGVYGWRIKARVTSVEPAAPIVAGSSGWVGYSLLTFEARARPCH